jgi:hypothetical protein
MSHADEPMRDRAFLRGCDAGRWAAGTMVGRCVSLGCDASLAANLTTLAESPALATLHTPALSLLGVGGRYVPAAL